MDKYVRQSCEMRKIALLKNPAPVHRAAVIRPRAVPTHRPETEATAHIAGRKRARRQDNPQNALAKAPITQMFLGAAPGGNRAREDTIGITIRAMLRRTCPGAVVRRGPRLGKGQVGRKRETEEADHSGIQLCLGDTTCITNHEGIRRWTSDRFSGITYIFDLIMGNR